MKTIILFRSMTGHSKKIAKAIGTEIGIEPQNIKEKPQFAGIDLAFIIGGIYSGKSLPDMAEYCKSLNSNAVKKVVLITSSASDKCGQDKIRTILKENKIQVLDEEYRCRGNFLFIKLGHPNKKEIEGAVEFAKRITSTIEL